MPAKTSAPAVAPAIDNNENANGTMFRAEINWLHACLQQRLEASEGVEDQKTLPKAPTLPKAGNGYCDTVHRLGLDDRERLLMILALLPHLRPDLLTELLGNEGKGYMPKYPFVGGVISKHNFRFYPTLNTFSFIAMGKYNPMAAFMEIDLLNHSALFRDQIIELTPPSEGIEKQTAGSHLIAVAPEYVRYFLTGAMPKPDFGSDFPATLIETDKEWDDLVLDINVHNRLKKVLYWIEHGSKLIEMGGSKINPSFPVLFYGSPGTGKTLTAKLIGKHFNRPVFRIDLSMMVSKYIGETEKNLKRLFDRARGKNWILFFDEADSLLGKRTQISDSHDKWANLEVSYLLQLIEDYTGLVIMATNMSSNIDSAMTRRFQMMIEFTKPNPGMMADLWKKALPEGFSFADDADLPRYNRNSLTGANVANIVKMACLECLSRNTFVISKQLLLNAVQQELSKEHRTL